MIALRMCSKISSCLRKRAIGIHLTQFLLETKNVVKMLLSSDTIWELKHFGGKKIVEMSTLKQQKKKGF